MTREQLQAMIDALQADVRLYDDALSRTNGRSTVNAQIAETCRCMAATLRDAYKAALAVTP